MKQKHQLFERFLAAAPRNHAEICDLFARPPIGVGVSPRLAQRLRINASVLGIFVDGNEAVAIPYRGGVTGSEYAEPADAFAVTETFLGDLIVGKARAEWEPLAELYFEVTTVEQRRCFVAHLLNRRGMRDIPAG